MKMNEFKVGSLKIVFLLCGFLYLTASCSSTIQNRSVKTSGFLKDYSMLRAGTGDQALMVYINREVNFDLYQKVMIDPVSVIVSQDSNMAKISAEDRQKIANYFHAALEQNLGQKYIITSKPGSLTMRLRFALTDIKESSVLMDNVSTGSPDSANNQVEFTASSKPSYLGDANAEMEILDSMTGQRLAAAVDSRSGVWNSAKNACDYWAKRVAQRLDDIAAGDYLLKGH